MRTVLVEDASRFARDLVTQELGVLLLIKRGVRVLTANDDDLTYTSDPSRVMMWQIAGSFTQYENARLVAKLRGARVRMREAKGPSRAPAVPRAAYLRRAQRVPYLTARRYKFLRALSNKC
jgi:DNA invertase Pin-like site-specific DNA recombinase